MHKNPDFHKASHHSCMMSLAFRCPIAALHKGLSGPWSLHMSAYVSLRQHTSACVAAQLQHYIRVCAIHKAYRRVSVSICTFVLVKQYFCASKASKLGIYLNYHWIHRSYAPAYARIRQHTSAYVINQARIITEPIDLMHLHLNLTHLDLICLFILRQNTSP